MLVDIRKQPEKYMRGKNFQWLLQLFSRHLLGMAVQEGMNWRYPRQIEIAEKDAVWSIKVTGVNCCPDQFGLASENLLILQRAKTLAFPLCRLEMQLVSALSNTARFMLSRNNQTTIVTTEKGWIKDVQTNNAVAEEAWQIVFSPDAECFSSPYMSSISEFHMELFRFACNFPDVTIKFGDRIFHERGGMACYLQTITPNPILKAGVVRRYHDSNGSFYLAYCFYESLESRIVSFVNGHETYRGGTHVKMLKRAFRDALLDSLGSQARNLLDTGFYAALAIQLKDACFADYLQESLANKLPEEMYDSFRNYFTREIKDSEELFLYLKNKMKCKKHQGKQ